MGEKKHPRVKDWNQGQKVVCPVTQLLHALVILLQFPRKGVKMWYRKKKEIYRTYGTYGTSNPTSSEQVNFSVDFSTMVMCEKSEGNKPQSDILVSNLPYPFLFRPQTCISPTLCFGSPVLALLSIRLGLLSWTSLLSFFILVVLLLG